MLCIFPFFFLLLICYHCRLLKHVLFFQQISEHWRDLKALPWATQSNAAQHSSARINLLDWFLSWPTFWRVCNDTVYLIKNYCPVWQKIMTRSSKKLKLNIIKIGNIQQNTSIYWQAMILAGKIHKLNLSAQISAQLHMGF